MSNKKSYWLCIDWTIADKKVAVNRCLSPLAHKQQRYKGLIFQIMTWYINMPQPVMNESTFNCITIFIKIHMYCDEWFIGVWSSSHTLTATASNKKEICQTTIFATKNIQTFYDRRNIDQLALYNIYQGTVSGLTGNSPDLSTFSVFLRVYQDVYLFSHETTLHT